MGGNPISIIDPARVKGLLVPVGQVKHSRFLSFLERFEHEDVVQLRDVSPDSRPHTTMFSPLAFPAGRVLFDMRTSVPPAAHLALSPFEIYRQPLVVIAVADGRNYSHRSAIDGQSLEEAKTGESLCQDSIDSLLRYRQQLVSELPLALVHQIIVFDCDAMNQKLPHGIAAVPSPAKSKTTTMKTVMCDLTSQLLAEMTSLARSLQELASVESPKVPRQNIQRPLARYFDSSRPASADPSQQLDDAQRYDHRMSMPAHMLANMSSRSSTPEVRPASVSSGAQTPPTAVNGIMSSPSSPPSRPPDLPRPMSHDRASLQGFGSNSLSERERTKHRGRMDIVIGSLYMLAGLWPDAVKELSDGITVAKAYNDHLWHAKALDYLLVICLLNAWAELDFRVSTQIILNNFLALTAIKLQHITEIVQIPQALYSATEKISSGSVKTSKEAPTSSHGDPKSTSMISSRDSVLKSLSDLLPDLVTSIQNLYSRAWTFSEDKLPQLSFSDSGLRFARLLTVVEASNGSCTSACMRQVVLNTPSPKDQRQSTQVTTFPSKAEITTFLFRSFPSPGTDESLTVVDRTRILAGIASILAELGYHRKKAYVLKELLEGLVPALVEARKRGAAEMGLHPAASLASLDAALIGARNTGSQGAHGEDEIGVHSFLDMVCRAYGIHVNQSSPASSEDKVAIEDTPELIQRTTMALPDRKEAIAQRTIYQASGRHFGSLELKCDILRLCIHVCDALPHLEGILRFSAELLRTSGSGIAPGLEDSNAASSLSINEQLRLWNNISRTVGAARQLGLKYLAADYWDEFLVRGVDIIPSTSKTPIPHARDELESVTTSGADANSGPFLYNPFSQNGPAKTAKPLVVANEEATFRVTLQNLQDFDLEIESIRLGSYEDEYSARAQAVVVGPYRTQSVFLSARWPASGLANISGCTVKIRGCYERWFPLFDQPWSLKPGVKTLHPENRGQNRESQPNKGTRAPPGPVPSSLDLEVIPALPNIVLQRSTLAQSAIMLLEGETKTFNLTLFNASKTVAADLVLLTFEDSTRSQLQAAMANKDLRPGDLYELELVAARPSLRWLREDGEPSPAIGPGNEITLKIEVAGKPGLSDASILVSYAHLGVPRHELKDRFFTRQHSIPLLVTVNASVDLTRTDVLPFTPSFAWQNQKWQNTRSSPPSASKSDLSPRIRRPSSMSTGSKTPKHINNENRFQTLLSRIGLSPNDKSHCLVCLDCRNSWPSPLSISIQVRSPSTSPSPTTKNPTSPSNTDTMKLTYTVHEFLHPGHTKRILLLLPRLRLRNHHRPVPSPGPSANKQFVLTAGPKESHEAQVAARENFWYREALLEQIHATWTEESTSRTGLINMRGIRLSQRMVEAYKLPDVEVRMALTLSPLAFSAPGTSSPSNGTSPADNNDDEAEAEAETETKGGHTGITQLSPTTYLIPPSVPITVTTTLTNHSHHPIHPLLRLQPRVAGDHPHHVALELGRKFLVHGLLQRVLPVLGPGERKDVDVGFTILGRGRWAVGGVVEEIR
ncbi:MAG: hypothetical protein Q9211_006595, partial [Gyalolechia sp. 1 TL-2023]